MIRRLALLLAVAASCQESGGSGLEASDEEFVTFPPGASVDEVLKAIDEGLGARNRGPRQVYFVVLRDGARHGTAYRPAAFHAHIGAGITLPEGTLRVRRLWACSGYVDGTNEQPERYGISVAVEPGAVLPYSEAIRGAAATFVEALATRVPIHPDCVLAMGEVAYAKKNGADAAERELAKAAREGVPVPAPDGRVVIRSGGKDVPVDVERRQTPEGIEVGMMFRTRFDGDNRGMLFEYPHSDYRHFWMRNCLFPIDVAYINGDKIEEIHTMEPAFGLDPRHPRYYDSSAVANIALEMPAGWFAKHGVKAGDRISVGALPPPPGK